MKKVVGLMLLLSIGINTIGVASAPGAAPVAARAKIDPIEVTAALMNMLGALAINIPKLMKDIPNFPDRVKPQLKQFQSGILYIYNLPKDTPEQKAIREQGIQILFLQAVNLLVEVNNIVDNIFAMVQQLGPLVTAIDKQAGAKVSDAVKIMADTLYAVSIVSKGMAQTVRAELEGEGKSTKNIPEAPKPEKPELPTEL